MKKLLVVFLSLVPVVALGTTVCAVNNSYIAVFKKTITTGSVDEHDDTNKTWQVTMTASNYSKTVTGIAACNEVSGTVNSPKTNLYTTTTDVGPNCWCKMEPVEAYGYETGIASYWVLNNVYADAGTCASSCATKCATDMAAAPTSTFRSFVFEAIW